MGHFGSESGLVIRTAFKAAWPGGNALDGGFDSHPLPPTIPLLLPPSLVMQERPSETSDALKHRLAALVRARAMVCAPLNDGAGDCGHVLDE